MRPTTSRITNPDPGPDGDEGTADDPGTFVTYFDYPPELAGADFLGGSTYINDSSANRSYRAIEVALHRRYAGNWQMRTSFSATNIDEPYVQGEGIGSDLTDIFPDDPNAEINTARNTWEWSYRVMGSYLAPFGVLASGNLDFRSGDNWARTVRFRGGEQIPRLEVLVEPSGTRRLDTLTMLDLRGEKRFSLGGATKRLRCA